tara:strand:+ start:694 stop:978 length:285 start_codon:yes stop_codon:yes gene_type:complete
VTLHGNSKWLKFGIGIRKQTPQKVISVSWLVPVSGPIFISAVSLYLVKKSGIALVHGLSINVIHRSTALVEKIFSRLGREFDIRIGIVADQVKR